MERKSVFARLNKNTFMPIYNRLYGAYLRFSPYREVTLSQAAVDFLTSWEAIGPWLVMAANPDRERRLIVERCNSIDQLSGFLTQYEACNLYWFPNSAEPTVTTTPEKGQVTAVNVIHVDVDLARGIPNDETNLSNLLARVKAIEPTPTLLLCSGGGYQAVWRYETPLEPDFISVAEARNKSVEALLDADHCHNVNRWLRLPGTTNYPSKAKRDRGRTVAQAYIVSFDPQVTWSHTRDPMPRFREDYVPLEPEQDEAPTEQQILTSLPAKLRKLIISGDTSDFRGDRSALVFYVVIQLVRLGWSDDKIVPILYDVQYGVSAHCRSKANPEREAKRQVERCRERVQEDWRRFKNGDILPNDTHNLNKATAELGITFDYDVFSQRLYYSQDDDHRLIDDNVCIKLRYQVQAKCDFLPAKDTFVDYVIHRCTQNERHPVREYLDNLSWDGTNRIDDWLIRYGGADDTELNRTVGRIFLLAAVRRIRQPGCKFDEMVVLVDPTQGTNKSSAIAALAVRDEWFTDSVPLGAKDKEVIEQLQGKWLVECAELTGLKHRDVEELKQFLSRRYDRARLAYGRLTHEAARECVFFGTTNQPLFLKDEQNRRFWPVTVTSLDAQAITRDRDQLWAEAAQVEARGESIRLDPSLYQVAKARQDEHRSYDPWLEIFSDLLGNLTGKVGSFALWQALGKPIHLRLHSDNQRIAAVMRELGWEGTLRNYLGKVQRVYCRGTEAERMEQIYIYTHPVKQKIVASYEEESDVYYTRENNDE